MTDEWCCEKLENLKIKEQRLSTLKIIHSRLNEAPNLTAIVTNRLLSSPELYDCLEENNGEQVDLASEILSICMGSLSIVQADMPRLLERALKHQKPRIRALALNAIKKELDRNTGEIETSDFLIPHLFDALQQEETEVGVPSLNILTMVIEDRLHQDTIKEKLLQMLSRSEVVKCRVYELAVTLSKRSPATLLKLEFLLDRAFDDLSNDDILVQVNIFEILVPLAEQNHGLIYLEKKQVFEIMGKRIETLEENPVDRLLVPGIMKFFGKIAYLQPQKIIVGYPQLVKCLFECFHTAEITILPVALDTLANLAWSQQGKVLLQEHYDESLPEIFQDYASFLRNLSSDLKNRTFCSLQLIFTNDGPSSDEISDILHKWFIYLADGMNMQFLMDFCRNPFPDIKVACLSFIRTICMNEWGVEALKETGGFVEYLLDRQIEFNKEAKHAKFELIKLLADNAMFEVQTHIQLRAYINEGPYYVQSSMDVAVEGN